MTNTYLTVSGRIRRELIEMVPSGGNWHQELLEQMNTEVPNLRPVVISNEVRGMLEAYRGFRHVVRNVYTLHFDERQIDALLERLPVGRSLCTNGRLIRKQGHFHDGRIPFDLGPCTIEFDVGRIWR